MIAAAVTPISIELDKGPHSMDGGIRGVRKTKTESKIVPGNVILRASICRVSLLEVSSTRAEK